MAAKTIRFTYLLNGVTQKYAGALSRSALEALGLTEGSELSNVKIKQLFNNGEKVSAFTPSMRLSEIWDRIEVEEVERQPELPPEGPSDDVLWKRRAITITCLAIIAFSLL